MMNVEELDRVINTVDEDDMGSILRTFEYIRKVEKQVNERKESMKNKLKAALKERNWTSYKDEDSNITVSITTQERETIDKKMLNMLLNEDQYNNVVKKKTSERLSVVTEEDRQRMKKFTQKAGK